MQIEHKKNTPYYLASPIIDVANPDKFLTGATPTVSGYYKDGVGAWTTFTPADVIVEIGTTGVYELDLTDVEMNHDQVLLIIITTGGADTAYLFDMRTEVDSAESVLADNVIHGGAGTEIYLKHLNVTNNDGNAVDIISPNTVGLNLEGDIGIRAKGDTYGMQMYTYSGAALNLLGMFNSTAFEIDGLDGKAVDVIGPIVTGIPPKVDVSEINSSPASAVNLGEAWADSVVELATIPGVDSKLLDKINWLYSLAMNKREATATLETVRNRADTANLGSAVIGDDNVTFVKETWQ